MDVTMDFINIVFTYIELQGISNQFLLPDESTAKDTLPFAQSDQN